MKQKNIIIVILFILSFLSIMLISCEPNFIEETIYIWKKGTDKTTSYSSDKTTNAAFWGLPALRFINWRPNIHIKASSDNGILAGRLWDGSPDVNPDSWSLFEYSQILYYDSNYIGMNIPQDEEVTVDNTVIMPLSFEQKMYKRVFDQEIEPNKYDVTWDKVEKAVVVSLNTINSNYLILKPGCRIAVIATQRPKQWGAVNDYTVIDSIPKNNSLQMQTAQKKSDTTNDRAFTREINYFTYTGGTMEYIDTTQDTNTHWFKKIKVEQEKITLYMPYFDNGNNAKTYWDTIDTEPIAPFMLFWILIQQ